ncbi:hypothetical protein Poli38472_010392 [Pythium oligandrum]|uniref:Uncharacterized protein n=1 Tax=Pythium oligandrum TaxID=41045 RepID=A0A8K1C2Z2_PYTOL|nr:hypothetical protein Poli38472_010392 [Pythium oligandrum]|eukprot:TMW55510.1 hypothetical protein Poli38472_010392 [Pythium oligandrum]
MDESCLYELQLSRPLPEVDLAPTLFQKCLSPSMYKRLVQFLCVRYGRIAAVYRLSMVFALALLFVGDGPAYLVMSVSVAVSMVSVLITAMFLSLGVLRLLVQNYEFRFLTLFNVVQWVTFACLFQDARVVMCVSFILGCQMAISADANVRTFHASAKTSLFSVPIFVVFTTLATWRMIAKQRDVQFDVLGTHVDAIDILTFTASTLVLFLGKMGVLKRVGRARIVSPTMVILPCMTIKAVLRITHHSSVEASSNVCSKPITRPVDKPLHLQQLQLRPLAINQLDGLRTVLPSEIWFRTIMKHRRLFRLMLYTIGFAGFILNIIQSAVDFGRQEAKDKATNALWSDARSSLALLYTCFFCGTFVLSYQRDLLRLLFRNFDVLFSSCQFLIFGLCLCDMVRWNPHRVAVVVTWIVWYHWAVTLDALTPTIKRRVFGFSKRLAAPVTATIIVGGAAVFYEVVFSGGTRFHDRVLWEQKLSSSHTVVLRTQTILWMRAHFGALVKLYRVGVVCFIALLFIDHGPMFTLLLMLIPPTYDFWFMTVFSFLQWSVLGCVFSDARILMCVTGFIGTQQAMLVDANVRNFRSTVATGVLGILLYVLLTSLLAWDQIAGQHPFNLHLYDKK